MMCNQMDQLQNAKLFRNDNVDKPSLCARVGCGKVAAAWTHLKEIGWGKLLTVKSEVWTVN